jgi:hypothetical protein
LYEYLQLGKFGQPKNFSRVFEFNLSTKNNGSTNSLGVYHEPQMPFVLEQYGQINLPS